MEERNVQTTENGKEGAEKGAAKFTSVLGGIGTAKSTGELKRVLVI